MEGALAQSRRRGIALLGVGALSVLATAVGALLVLRPATGGRLTTRGVVYFRAGYERTGLSRWEDRQAMASNRAVIVTGPSRRGRHAARFVVEPGDDVNHWPGERSTVAATQAQTNGYAGHDAWYAWSSLVARGSVLSQQWNDLTSWHQTGSTCPAPLHVAVSSDWTLTLDSRGGALNTASCAPQRHGHWSLGTLRRGVWYDFVVHVRWSPNPRVGFVEAWLNRKLVLPLTHAATLYDGQGVYLKQGWYRGPTRRGRTVVYNDGNVVAGTYERAITAFPAGSWPATPAELPQAG